MSIVNRVLNIPEEKPLQRGPKRVYAIIERFPGEGETDDRIVFQTIDAEWFDSFELTSRDRELRDFLGARFFVIKLAKRSTEKFVEVLSNARHDNVDVWFEIRFRSPRTYSPDRAQARIYEDADRQDWNLRIKSITAPTAAALAKLTKVFQLPDQWKTDPKTALSRLVTLKKPFVIAYDVGQGAANGIHAPEGWVEAYFDFGGGTTSHKKTFPEDLRFCFSKKPLIVLSHWHADHWICASKHDLRALESDWIVPDQKVGPADYALALSIIHKGGKVSVVPSNSGLVVVGLIAIGCCTGSNKNESGLAMLIHTEQGDVLLPGDCGYEHLPDFWGGASTPPKLIGLAAPHHGGLTSRQTKPTPSPLGPESKLAYSFGKPNGYKHSNPAVEGVHQKAGWSAAMTRKTPALRSTQGHVLLTPLPTAKLPCKASCSYCTLGPVQ